MQPFVRFLAAAGALAVLSAACVGGGAEVSDPVPAVSVDSVVIDDPAVNDSLAPSTASTTTAPVADRLVAPPADVLGAVRADDGTARPIVEPDGEVWVVFGACGGDELVPTASALLVGAQHVVIDAGRGGADRGVEADGLIESELNLDVARRTAETLRSLGVLVTLTRDDDADLSSRTRGALAPAVGAQAFISIHHVEPGLTMTESARPAVFHQIADEESRRLAGLVHEELTAAFASFDQNWAALDDPGVKPLLNQRGDNFHVVLETSGETPAVFVEALALGGNETTLLAKEEGRAAEAAALADALVRFLVGDEQGSGFIEPTEIVRTAPTSNTPGGCGS